jgi:hypothetical protein
LSLVVKKHVYSLDGKWVSLRVPSEHSPRRALIWSSCGCRLAHLVKYLLLQQASLATITPRPNESRLEQIEIVIYELKCDLFLASRSFLVSTGLRFW